MTEGSTFIYIYLVMKSVFLADNLSLYTRQLIQQCLDYPDDKKKTKKLRYYLPICAILEYLKVY